MKRRSWKKHVNWQNSVFSSRIAIIFIFPIFVVFLKKFNLSWNFLKKKLEGKLAHPFSERFLQFSERFFKKIKPLKNEAASVQDFLASLLHERKSNQNHQEIVLSITLNKFCSQRLASRKRYGLLSHCWCRMFIWFLINLFGQLSKETESLEEETKAFIFSQRRYFAYFNNSVSLLRNF